MGLNSVTGELVQVISSQLVVVGFTDTYLFNIARRHGFLRTHSDHDIAMKFRGSTLFGEDLLAQKEAPSRAFAEQWAEAGLRTSPLASSTRARLGGRWSGQRPGRQHEAQRRPGCMVAAAVYLRAVEPAASSR
jgi:hypothetical protein